MEAITEHAIDLVVVGTRGSRGWQGIFMGSNVEKVVRTSPVPVFAARQLTHLRDIKNIIFPCDLIHADHYGLDQLKKLQVQLGARLHLLRVDTTGHADHEMLTEEIKNYARFHGLSKYSAHVIASPDEKDGILQFAKETGADMIAMTTRGASDLNHLYNFSVAADVVNHSHLLTWTCLQQGMSQYVA
jgi:nucleotide-binding universal stress UspA family protein